MKRIIDKQTNLFLRDDFEYNEETEMAIDIEMQQPPIKAKSGICPMWDGEKWVQNVGPPEPEPQPQEPSEAERLEALEMLMVDILGGGF